MTLRERVAPLREMVELVAARDYLLPTGLVLGMIEVESGGSPWAWNPEPGYRYLYDVANRRPFRALTMQERSSEKPPQDFPYLAGDRDQEWWGQQASFGLMQVMGAVAREHGCDVPYLTALCDPALGLLYGCRHLSSLMSRYAWNGQITAAIAAYNAGSPRKVGTRFENQHYVDRVMAAARGYGFGE